MYLVTFTVSQEPPKAAWRSGHRTISLLVRHKYVWYNGAQSLQPGGKAPRNGAAERTRRAQQAGCCSTPPKARTGGVYDEA